MLAITLVMTPLAHALCRSRRRHHERHRGQQPDAVSENND